MVEILGALHVPPTCKVVRVSSRVTGVMVQMMTVLAFPPREFCRMRVSLLSL